MMDRPDSGTRVRLSVLDRLTDKDPENSHDFTSSRPADIRELKNALWRDLNALLNSRRREEEIPEAFPECNNSFLTFGIPDFTSYSLKSPSDQDRLRRSIELAIRRFEPRLASVVVRLEPRAELDPRLRFRVDALLKVSPRPEPIRFDTVLQADTGQFFVSGDSR